MALLDPGVGTAEQKPPSGNSRRGTGQGLVSPTQGVPPGMNLREPRHIAGRTWRQAGAAQPACVSLALFSRLLALLGAAASAAVPRGGCQASCPWGGGVQARGQIVLQVYWRAAFSPASRQPFPHLPCSA